METLNFNSKRVEDVAKSKKTLISGMPGSGKTTLILRLNGTDLDRYGVHRGSQFITDLTALKSDDVLTDIIGGISSNFKDEVMPLLRKEGYENFLWIQRPLQVMKRIWSERAAELKSKNHHELAEHYEKDAKMNHATFDNIQREFLTQALKLEFRIYIVVNESLGIGTWASQDKPNEGGKMIIGIEKGVRTRMKVDIAPSRTELLTRVAEARKSGEIYVVNGVDSPMLDFRVAASPEARLAATDDLIDLRFKHPDIVVDDNQELEDVIPEQPPKDTKPWEVIL